MWFARKQRGVMTLFGLVALLALSSVQLSYPNRPDSQTGAVRRRDLTAWLAAEPKKLPLFVK